MTVASFIGEGLAPPASLAGRRVSLQHTVVTFLLIELTLFLLCAIAPSFYLEKFGFLSSRLSSSMRSSRPLASEPCFTYVRPAFIPFMQPRISLRPNSTSSA
jgi:hypothetical protein